MTKTEKYSQILSKFILEVEAKYKNASDERTTIGIIDTERHHYQVAVYGFQQAKGKDYKTHDFTILFHFDIIDEQVWIQCNNTDWDFGEDFIQLGIPKSDIILGFVSEDARYYHGYGVEKVA